MKAMNEVLLKGIVHGAALLLDKGGKPVVTADFSKG